jgi:hypothetical protein
MQPAEDQERDDVPVLFRNSIAMDRPEKSRDRLRTPAA